MSYNPFVEAEPEQIARLGFNMTKRPYVYYSDTLGMQTAYLYETDYKTWMTVQKVLQGQPGHSIVKKDKVFVLPGNPLPQYRIKEYLKNIGATTTRDIEKATIILGNNALGQELSSGYQPKVADVMFAIDDIMGVEINNDDNWDITIDKFKLENFKDEELLDVVLSKSAYDAKGYDTNIEWKSSSNPLYYIYPVGVQIVYHALARKIKIVDQETITENAHSQIYLKDKDTYRSIDQMLRSSNGDDTNIAVELLCGCNLDDSVYHTWKLAYEYGSKVRNNGRSKNKSFFMDQSDWETLEDLDPMEFAQYLMDKDELTPEIFDKLEEDIKKKAMENWDHDVYDIQLVLKPKYQAIYEPSKDEEE